MSETWIKQTRDAVANGATRVSYSGPVRDVPLELREFTELTIVGAAVHYAQMNAAIAEVNANPVAALSVSPYWVGHVSRNLKGPTKLACVIGFPDGSTWPETKAFETRRALRDGAKEIDLTINSSAILCGVWRDVEHEVRLVADACRESGARFKLVVETDLITEADLERLCVVARRARASHVFTATGTLLSSTSQRIRPIASLLSDPA